MAVYDGEVVSKTVERQDGSGAKPYTGEVIPLSAPAAPQGGLGGTPAGAATGRAAVPQPFPPQNRDSDLEFGAVNLNRGLAGLAGLPVDTGINAANLGIAAIGTAQGAMGGNIPDLINPASQVGSSAWIENMMRRANIITPAGDPQSGPGRYMAAAFQAAPSAMMGRPSIPQVPRALAATTSSALGGELARDIGGDEAAPLGALLPGMGKMQHQAPGERATQARQGRDFGKAREMGIPVPPRDLKIDKGQQKFQNVGNKDLGQPEGTEFTPKSLQDYRNQEWTNYENVIKSPALKNGVTPTKTFQTEIQSMGDEIEKARGTLPETFKGMRPVLKLLSEYGYAQLPQGAQGTIPPRAQPIPADVAMRAVKKLRSDAATNFTSDKPEKVEMAHIQKRLANAIDSLIEENVKDPALMQSFRQSRTNIAKSHDYEAAMGPGGKIDAAKLARMQAEGKPLSGGAADIAQVSGAFPSAVAPERSEEMFTKKVSPMAVTHPPAVAAHQAPRLWDKAMMNPVGQFMIDPRGRLTPEQQQMLRYLSAATAQNRGGIPTPP